MVKTALDDKPVGGGERKQKQKTRRGDDAAAADDDTNKNNAGGAGAGAGGGGDMIEQMQAREKRLKRELNARAQKFAVGAPVNAKKIADRKTKAHVRYAESLADQAVTDAALHEKWLLPSTPGMIEAEGMERTYRFQQAEIAKAVDVNAARKAFDLDLPHLGPYSVDFTPNGRDLLIGEGEGLEKRRRPGGERRSQKKT